MTITYTTNNAEGGSNGTAVTTGNSGGASGTAWSLVSAPSGSITYATGSAEHGSLGYHIVPATSQQAILRWTGFNNTTGAFRGYWVTEPGNPAANTGVYTVAGTTGTLVLNITITTGGKWGVTDAGGAGQTSTNSRQAGDRIELTWTVGTTTSNGAWDFYLYRGDSLTATEHLSSTTANLGTANWDRFEVGKHPTNTWVGPMDSDDIAVASGTTTLFGPPTSPPTASFTASEAALTASVNGTASTAVSPATISSYDWSWGDSTADGSGSTATHTYTAAGTYTVTLTVTDSNALTNSTTQSVTVAAPAGTVTVQSVSVSTGWSASSGTVLSCISDGDPTTFATSPGNPSSQEFDVVLQAVTPPASGQPFKVFVACDRLLSSTGTMNAQLYEGSTLRSSLTAQAIVAGSGSSVAGMTTLTFPWSDVQNVTTGGWNALTLKLQVSAS